MWWWSLALGADPMVLQVVDAQSGDAIPCATLTTVHQVRLTTDDEGLAAFLEPGLMGQDVWFEPSADGFRHAPDFFGLVGETIEVVPGGFARIEMQREGPPAPCATSDHTRRLLDAGVPDRPMSVRVVDAATGRGVPLAEVVAGDQRWITDSSGTVAILDPDLYGQELTFEASAWHGVGPSLPTSATVDDGASVVLEVDRHTPAERLYRLTGADPFRDTELLGEPTPFPALRGEVVGIDSCLEVLHEGSPLWLFGDTLRPSYPLGHFDTAAAFPSGDLEAGVQLDFLVDDDGFSRGVADLSDDGPVWLTIPSNVSHEGHDVVLATYGVYAGLTAIERGFAVLEPGSTRFRAVGTLPLGVELSHQSPVRAGGHVTLREGLRFPDVLDEAVDLETWQTWSPIDGGMVDRHPDGTARWAWRPGVEVPDDGLLAAADRWSRSPREPDTGVAITLHYGDVAYNRTLRRFIQVVTREGGDSAWLGELWLTVADTPFGPWSYARRLTAFDDYTTYNPMIHDAFDTDGARIHFQATYTDFFAGAPEKTSRYDYNQLMFALDLDDPRARLPVPYYVDDGRIDPTTGPDLGPDVQDPVLAFHAYESPHDDAVAIGRSVPSCAGGRWIAGASDPLLWAAPAEGPGLVPLWDQDGSLTVGELPADTEPLGWVWPAVGATHVPAHAYPPEARLDAGSDTCVPSGTTVRLSAEAEGGVVAWRWDGGEADGPDVDLDLGAGDHVVTATLTTPEGVAVEDRVLIHVDDEEVPDDDTGVPPDTHETPPRTARPDAAPSSEGCGCTAGGGATGPWGLLLLLTLRRRQPRQAARIDR